MTVSEKKSSPICGEADIKAYETMGCHAEVRSLTDGGQTVVYLFRTWAPHAVAVYLVGDFNGWSESSPMHRISENGIWEAEVDSKYFTSGVFYKYRVISENGDHFKADPYATSFELPPADASLVKILPPYSWQDEGWLALRRRRFIGGSSFPLNAFSVHLGSWLKNESGGFLNYTEIASELACYVKQMGYTHVKLFPITEHRSYESLGREVSGYFAPTARYGEPRDFMNFVDIMHEAGIGVILDWVPSVFSQDAQSLFLFDGEPLYERMDGEDGCRFDTDRVEVKSFLLSAINFWIERYHIDGFCMCRVDERDRQLLKEISACVCKTDGSVLLLSELACDGYITVGQTSEEGGSWFANIPNVALSEERRMASVAKLRYAYRMLFPGKKISLMGDEKGEPVLDRERICENSGAWEAIQLFSAELNHFYLSHPFLWSCSDASLSRYCDRERGVETYCHRADDQVLLTVFNFSEQPYPIDTLSGLTTGEYEEILNSNDVVFGGEPLCDRSAGGTVAPFAVCVFRLWK